MRLVISAAIALLLVGCGPKQAARPDPPMVTACLDAPSAYVPDEPERPADGAAIPDAYVQALLGWGNSLLGVIAQDRITWRGERRCITRLRELGHVR